MKKILAIFIFLGIITAGFCSSGLMANLLNAELIADTEVSACCNDKTVSHYGEEVTAVIASFGFTMPAVLLLLVSFLLFVYIEPAIFQSLYSPYNFHKFSRGVFQLE